LTTDGHTEFILITTYSISYSRFTLAFSSFHNNTKTSWHISTCSSQFLKHAYVVHSKQSQHHQGSVHSRLQPWITHHATCANLHNGDLDDPQLSEK